MSRKLPNNRITQCDPAIPKNAVYLFNGIPTYFPILSPEYGTEQVDFSPESVILLWALGKLHSLSKPQIPHLYNESLRTQVANLTQTGTSVQVKI